jgi:selenide,water dikinase
VPTLGGHTIDDPEPKYGLVAVGEVDPARMVTNDRARAGDALVLTKPIGSGVVATAVKQGAAPAAVIAEAVRVMSTLNRAAAEAMVRAEVRAATDVTGFGLLGHLHKMLRASGVSARIESAQVPLLPGARALAEAGHVPGGTRRNLEDLASHLDVADTVDDVTRTLLADAQTSGGLLMSVPPQSVQALLADLAGSVPSAVIVGAVGDGEPGRIAVG